MFTHRTKIRLCNTDSTGVLYFPEQFKLALEAFEELLHTKGFSLQQLIDGDVLMPVVRAEANYTAPLFVGDLLEIALTVQRLGTSSITTHYRFFNPDRQVVVGEVTLVHVTVSKQSRQSIPIPAFIRAFFGASDSGKI